MNKLINEVSTYLLQHKDNPVHWEAWNDESIERSIVEDKPIMLDYYVDTLNKKAYLGEDAETKEKMLIKSNEEFTSVIQKVYKIQEDFIILTENSLYIVSAKCPKRTIQAKALRERYE